MNQCVLCKLRLRKSKADDCYDNGRQHARCNGQMHSVKSYSPSARQSFVLDSCSQDSIVLHVRYFTICHIQRTTYPTLSTIPQCQKPSLQASRLGFRSVSNQWTYLFTTLKRTSLTQARFRTNRAANQTARVLLTAHPRSIREDITETIMHHGHKVIIGWTVKIELQHGAIQQNLADLARRALAGFQALRPTPWHRRIYFVETAHLSTNGTVKKVQQIGSKRADSTRTRE